MYNNLDAIYDFSMPENRPELACFKLIGRQYSKAFPEPRSEMRQVEALERSMRMTTSDAASMPDGVNLDEVILGFRVQPRNE